MFLLRLYCVIKMRALGGCQTQVMSKPVVSEGWMGIKAFDYTERRRKTHQMGHGDGVANAEDY